MHETSFIREAMMVSGFSWLAEKMNIIKKHRIRLNVVKVEIVEIFHIILAKISWIMPTIGLVQNLKASNPEDEISILFSCDRMELTLIFIFYFTSINCKAHRGKRDMRYEEEEVQM